MTLRMNLAVALTALTFLAPRTQEGGVLEYGLPASAGMDSRKLDQAVRLYRDAVEKDELRGAVLMVARHGRIVLHEALGWRHRGYRLPMEKDTLFRMASNTKPVDRKSTRLNSSHLGISYAVFCL